MNNKEIFRIGLVKILDGKAGQVIFEKGIDDDDDIARLDCSALGGSTLRSIEELAIRARIGWAICAGKNNKLEIYF